MTTIIKKLLFNFKNLMNYSALNLKERLTLILVLTGSVMATLGTILGFVYGIPFLFNVPNIVIAIICFSLPFYAKKHLMRGAMIVLLIVSILYFPFVYLTSGGYVGSGPVFFVMITVYYAFFFEKRSYVFFSIFLILYYVSVIIFSYVHPDIVTNYSSPIDNMIDVSFSVIAASVFLSIVSEVTFNAYEMERKKTEKLMIDLETQN